MRPPPQPDKLRATAIMVRGRVAVEPFDKQTTDTTIHPTPTVEATIPLERAIDANSYFSQAVLLRIGSVSTRFRGNNVASGHVAKTEDDDAIYRFEFPDLRISQAGNYSLRFDIYEMLESGATHVCQVQSRDFQVVDAGELTNGH